MDRGFGGPIRMKPFEVRLEVVLADNGKVVGQVGDELEDRGVGKAKHWVTQFINVVGRNGIKELLLQVAFNQVVTGKGGCGSIESAVDGSDHGVSGICRIDRCVPRVDRNHKGSRVGDGGILLWGDNKGKVAMPASS